MSSMCSMKDCKNIIKIYHKTRKCQTCNNYFCERCFIKEPDSFSLVSVKGWCIRCYSIVRNDSSASSVIVRPSEDPLPSKEEIDNQVSSYIDCIERDPFLDFEQVSEIGRGNFSKVYLVKNRDDQKTYALKHINNAEGSTNTPRFEFYLSALSTCVNVVPSYALYTHNNSYYILQQLMRFSVAQFIDSFSPLPEDVIIYIIRETLKGLQYLSQKNQIHRDIKSDNIFIDFEANIKIADFGTLAQLTTEARFKTTLAGTPLWLAPEVVMGNEYNTATDIWSLGIVAFELAEGRPPHSTCKSFSELFALICKGPVPRISSARGFSRLEQIITQCLQKEPSDRATAAELLESQLFEINELEVRNFLVERINR